MSKIDVLLTEEQVKARIKEMADDFSRRYEGKEVVLVGILTGSVFFMTELARQMTIPVEMDFMAASSYDGDTSTNKVLVTKDLQRSIEGRAVIVVEDIVDTGQTLSLLVKMLKERNPESLEVTVLLDKPSRRKVCIVADTVGFEIPDVFVVGWGLDYNQKYRNLKYIGNIVEL